MTTMCKKLQLFSLSLLATLLLSNVTIKAQNTCGTGAPGAVWDNWFNGEVEKYKRKMLAGKSNVVGYTIPVIVHIVHFGEAVGTFPNIPATQVASQIAVLNQDFRAAGAGIVNTPSQFTSAIANTGLEFCLAETNPQGVVLPELGIERLDATVNVWQSPTTPTLNLKDYFKTTIIPNRQWDPTKYLNIWVSDRPANYPLKGFATYPSATGLVGLFGNEFGTANDDGIWIWAGAFGTSGNVTAPSDKGRTLTHEIGHWLGLRHIWGDGNCLSDYCDDTPCAKQAHYGCVTTTPVDQCGVNQSPVGEMPMNFMDRTNDLCMYMFTKDQNIRMQTAMSMCANRNLLGTHNICSVTPVPTSSAAIAAFSSGTLACLNTPYQLINTSSGYPYPTFVWSSVPAASFSPNPNVASPSIKFSNPGQYTVAVVATNTVNSSTHSVVITVLATSCPTTAVCLDSIKMLKKVDSLISYRAQNNALIAGCQTGYAGFLTGTNCYKDKEFAQFYPPSSLSNVANPQVNSVIVFFDSLGTKGKIGTQINCKIYGGTETGGPGIAIGFKNDSLGRILNSPRTLSVSYLGIQNIPISNLNPNGSITSTTIIPFKFDFPKPVVINKSSGFFAGVESPVNSPLDSIKIVSSSKYITTTDSSAWFLQYNNTWRTYRSNRGNKLHLAIIPQISCGPATGIEDIKTEFNSNVTIMPNPNNGVFNLVFTLPHEEEINFNIYNSMGQLISAGKINNVKANVFEVNLSNQPSGIYFVNIANGKEKVMKKIIVNH